MKTELYYVVKYGGIALILLLVFLMNGCSTVSTDNDLRVWGHETAHCVHGFFHPEGYDPSTYDFSRQNTPKFFMQVVTYEDRDEFERLYALHRNGKEVASYITGFMRRTDEGCIIYVPALQPAQYGRG